MIVDVGNYRLLGTTDKDLLAGPTSPDDLRKTSNSATIIFLIVLSWIHEDDG